tara:strand:- start:49 stop:1455 length:1407 start_codon:yes stop_codon:yes gene_type:complete
MDKRFELLPELMKAAISCLQQLHNTPDALAMPAVLGVANLAAMPHYRIDTIKFGIKPISLYILCMLPTGMRKSTNYNEVSVGIERYEQQQWDRLRNDAIRYELDEKVYKKNSAKYIKDQEENGAFGTVAAPEPVRARETAEYRLKKATLNGIIDQLKSQSFVGLFSDEAGEFFNGHSFQGGRDAQSKSIEMSAALTTMWDGGTITRQTGMDSTRLSNRAVNMMFFLQEETVREFINNPVFSAQGFVHRILVTQSGSVPKMRLDLSDAAIEQDRQIRAQLDPFHARIESIIAQKLQLREDREFELQPRILRMTDTARMIFAHFHNERLNSVDQELRNWAGFGERLLEHALRIAGTLAAFEGAAEITDQHAAAAMDLMDFFIEQRINLELGISSRNMSQTLGVERLGQWMQDRAFVGTRRDIGNRVRWFKKLTESEKDQLLEDLTRSGNLEMVTTVAGNNKKTTVYTWSA